MKHHIALRLSVIAALSAGLFACSSSTTTTPPASTGPGVGSTFTVAHWVENTNAGDTNTYQVANADTTFRGKSHVMKVLQQVPAGQPQLTPLYFAVESNGNVSVWPKPSGSQADWFTIPYATQAHTATNWDRDGSDSTMTIADGDTPSAGSISIGGSSYPTQRAKVQLLLDAGDTTVHHYAYSPDLHFRVSDDQDAGMQFAEHWKLISFVKK